VNSAVIWRFLFGTCELLTFLELRLALKILGVIVRNMRPGIRAPLFLNWKNVDVGLAGLKMLTRKLPKRT
jgi:hypothetical protein